MLGKTAGGLFWMFRYLERSENTARLIEAGFRMALTRSAVGADEWKSIVSAAGVRTQFEARYNAYETRDVIDFLLRDPSNASSIKSSIEAAGAGNRTANGFGHHPTAKRPGAGCLARHHAAQRHL